MTEPAVRPWGAYTVLAEGDGFKVKTIEVRPEQRLSYQRHALVPSTGSWWPGKGWSPWTGAASRARGDARLPPGAAHRIHHDIVRLEDDYGRLPGEQRA